MKKVYFILFSAMMLCLACQWQMKPGKDQGDKKTIRIERYDQIELRYLTQGDYAALHEMNARYPRQTRTLVEDVLKIGRIDDADISGRFHSYFQDSVLQTIVTDVNAEYEDMSDIEKQLTKAFYRLHELLPDLEIPMFYTQIGALDQSIVVDSCCVGISLDKYLGADYDIYKKYNYSEWQRDMMKRQYIVPDCLGFYLLSHYPIPVDQSGHADSSLHMGKIQWAVNFATRHQYFDNEHVKHAARLMKDNPKDLERVLMEGR